jgi:carbon storage regulator
MGAIFNRVILNRHDERGSSQGRDEPAALDAKEFAMLVLSRMKNESIVINDDITIVIVEIRGDKVRIGVEAPKEVPVHRNEVYEALRRNGRQWEEPELPEEQSLPASITSQPAMTEPWAALRPPALEPLSVGAATAVVEQAAVNCEPPTVTVPRESPDGLCCPQCQSNDVRVERIKVAYKGAELVRWRECSACGNKFQTLERVEAL